MDKLKAYEIMGLKDNTTRDEIIKRYDIYSRKMKGREKDENGCTWDEITEAYNALMDYDYHDPNEDEKKRKRLNNPVYKLFKLDPEKAENFLHYYKWHILIGLAVIILIFSMVRSIVTRVPSDLNVDFIGAISVPMDGQDALKEIILNEITGLNEITVQYLDMSASDPQMQYGMTMKAILELTAGEVDVFIVDHEHYVQFAQQGAFVALDDKLLEGFGTSRKEQEHLVERVTETDTDGNITSQGEPEIYGIDIGESNILRSNGVYGEDLIITIFIRAPHYDKACELVSFLVNNR